MRKVDEELRKVDEGLRKVKVLRKDQALRRALRRAGDPPRQVSEGSREVDHRKMKVNS